MNDQEPLNAGPPLEVFPEMSDGSIMANIAVFLGELIQRNATQVVNGNEIAMQHVRVPLPFSRADGKDYLRIVDLWNDYRMGTAIEAPPRPCPACRSADSHFEFLSYDRYPYHACHHCGTWFVPHVIDDRVVEAFFAAIPDAKRISDDMMTGRDEGTRDSDRARFGHYFRMIRPLTRAGPARLRYCDIGCGVGHSVELATEFGWQAVGVDLSEVAVATARAKGRNVLRPGDLTSAGPYDVVSLFETLEHITDPDPVLAEVARVLAPAGIVVITVPNRASFEISILRGRCFHVFGGSENVGHINLFDAHGLGALLARHGLSLIFTDGQFSSDLPQVFSYLASAGPPALDLGKDQMDLAIPGPAYTVLNNLGPAFTSLERALKRSPILIAIACRTSDRASLAGAVAQLEQNWRDEMRGILAAEARALLKHESEFRAMLAAAQQEIARRDALLAHTVTDLQQEVNRRDALLEAVRARFDRTVEGRVLLGFRALVRLARRLGVFPSH